MKMTNRWRSVRIAGTPVRHRLSVVAILLGRPRPSWIGYKSTLVRDFAGFLIAWGMWISIWVSCASIAIAFAAYAGTLVPAIGASAALTAAVTLARVWMPVGRHR